MLKITFLFCLTAIRVFGDENYQNHASERIRQWLDSDDTGKANFVSIELERCPCWERLWGDEVEIAAGIVKICEQFSAFDNKAIELGVRQYWEKYCGSSTEDQVLNSAKVYLFLRVIFDVPETFPMKDMTRKEQSVLGEFWFQSLPGRVALLWPLKKDSTGKIVLSTSQSPSIGSHGPYEGLEDYKFLSKHFPRRVVSKK